MSVPTVDFLQEMLDALWAHIEGDARFTALGLKVYKLTDGRSLPITQNGGIAHVDLPACFVDAIRPSFGDGRTEPRRWEINVEVPISLAFANTQTHTSHVMLDCSRALMTFQLILGNRAAIQSRLGSSGVITDFSLEMGEVQPVLEPNGRAINFWVAELTVTLKRTFNPPAS